MTAARVMVLLLALFMAQGARAFEDYVAIDIAHARLRSQSGVVFDAQVKLTHLWDRNFSREHGEAVYTVSLPPAARHLPHAILFYRVGNQAEIYLNGHLLRKLGELGDTTQDWAKGPVFLEVPHALLNPDRPNQLIVRASMQPSRWGGLGPLLFGPDSVLMPKFRFNHAATQLGQVVIAATSAVIALFTLVLAIRQREWIFAFASLAALAWMLRAAERATVYSPLPWRLWALISVNAYILASASALLFLQHALDIRSRAFRNWNIGYLAASVPLTTAAYLAMIPSVWNVTVSLLGLCAMACLFLYLIHAVRSGTAQGFIMAVLCGFILATTAADLVLVGIRSRLLAESAGRAFSLTPYSMSLLLLGIFWIVADRYVRSSNEVRAAHEATARKLQLREYELALAFEAQRQEHGDKLLLQERQRMMRDMHDGMGAHLVSLLKLVKHGKAPASALESHVVSALEELRLTVDSLQPNEGDLATILGSLRYRMTPTLDAADIQLVWQVESLPPLAWLTPASVLHVQRIVLEIFTNAIKHSKATRIVVATARDLGGHLLIRISDNGSASTPAREGGHGLANINARAKALGGSLAWERSHTGTSVELRIPESGPIGAIPS
jgi:signal transduction histidine kinase